MGQTSSDVVGILLDDGNNRDNSKKYTNGLPVKNILGGDSNGDNDAPVKTTPSGDSNGDSNDNGSPVKNILSCDSDNKSLECLPSNDKESDSTKAQRELTRLLAIDFFTYDDKVNIDDYMITTKFKKDLLFEIAKPMINTDAWLYCMITYFDDYISISKITQNHFRKIQTPRSIHFASLHYGLVKFNTDNFIDVNTTSKLMAKYQNIIPSTTEIKDTNVIKEIISRNPYCTSKFVGKISIDHIVDAIMRSKKQIVISNNSVDEIIADHDLVAYDEHTDKRIINAYVEKITLDGRARTIDDYPLHIFVDNPEIDETLKVDALNIHKASALEVLTKDVFYDLYEDYLYNFRKYKTCESMLKWPFFPGFTISGKHIEIMLTRKDPRVINTLVYMYNIIDDGRQKATIKYAFTLILGIDINGMSFRERKIVCDVTNFKRMHNIYKLDPDVCLTAIAHNVENIKYAKCRLASFCREVHRLYPYHAHNLRYITEEVATKIASQNIELPQIYEYRTKILVKQIALIPQCKLTEDECVKFIFVYENIKKDKRKFDKLIQNPHIRRFLRSDAAARFQETQKIAVSSDILQCDEVMRSGKMTEKWIFANINYLFFDDW